MKKKVIYMLIVMSLSTMLVACGHEHTWVEATCTQAKHCSECEEIEGEALLHTFTEANYQQPAICEVCGITEGEKLQADFEKYGLSCDVQLDKIYDAKIMCYQDVQLTTSPKIVFSNYQVFDSDENHDAKEGYEWKTVDVTMFYYDENAMNFGWNGNYACVENYYDIEKNDATLEYNQDGIGSFTVNYKGQEYTECLVYETAIDKMMFDNDDKSSTRAFTVHVLIPVGYDGVIYGVRNAQIKWEEGQSIKDLDNADTLFFRFADEEEVKKFTGTNSLSEEIATKMVNHFYMSILGYFDNDTIGYFDSDGNMSINHMESEQFLGWAVDKYNIDKKSVLSKEVTEAVAIDYLLGKLDVPDELYIPTLID